MVMAKWPECTVVAQGRGPGFDLIQTRNSVAIYGTKQSSAIATSHRYLANIQVINYTIIRLAAWHVLWHEVK